MTTESRSEYQPKPIDQIIVDTQAELGEFTDTERGLYLEFLTSFKNNPRIDKWSIITADYSRFKLLDVAVHVAIPFDRVPDDLPDDYPLSYELLHRHIDLQFRRGNRDSLTSEEQAVAAVVMATQDPIIPSSIKVIEYGPIR